MDGWRGELARRQRMSPRRRTKPTENNLYISIQYRGGFCPWYRENALNKRRLERGHQEEDRERGRWVDTRHNESQVHSYTRRGHRRQWNEVLVKVIPGFNYTAQNSIDMPIRTEYYSLCCVSLSLLTRIPIALYMISTGNSPPIAFLFSRYAIYTVSVGLSCAPHTQNRTQTKFIHSLWDDWLCTQNFESYSYRAHIIHLCCIPVSL